MSRSAAALGAIVALGAALRIIGLDSKGFWEDEATTAGLLRMDPGQMLSELPDSERAPPLYYLLAWPWARIFGDGEVGLRSLSVLFGVGLVPVAYAAATELVSRRAGLVAASLVAVNPLLVWYSQEARAYELFALLSGIALYFFARSLRAPGGRTLAAWSLFSALALASHYFALFLFLAEAAWLLRALGRRREVLLAAAGPALVALALLPLALAQQDAHAGRDFIEEISLLIRVVEPLGFFLVGFELPVPEALGIAALAALLAGAGLLLLLGRGSEREQRGALIAGSVAATGVAIPLALALVGLDAFLYRNLIGVLLPLAVVVAAGCTAARAGRAGLACALALALLSAGVVIATADEPKYQREAWREAAAALGPLDREARAIVATPRFPSQEPLTIVYLPDSTVVESGAVRVSEVDVLALPRRPLGEIENAELPDAGPPPPPPGPGFELVERRREDDFLLLRYRAPGPRTLGYEALVASAADEAEPAVLLERSE